MSTADLQAEMMSRLAAYLKRELTLHDFLVWEAGSSLAPGMPAHLRADLDRLALTGEEIEAGLRDEAEFRALAEAMLRGAAAPRGT